MYAPPKPRREEFVKYWLLGLSTKKLDTYSTKYKVWSIFNIDYLALVKMDGGYHVTVRVGGVGDERACELEAAPRLGRN